MCGRQRLAGAGTGGTSGGRVGSGKGKNRRVLPAGAVHCVCRRIAGAGCQPLPPSRLLSSSLVSPYLSVHALQGGSELRRGRHRALRARILARNRKFPARASKKAREPLKLIEDSPTRTSSSSQVSLRDRSRALRPAPARYPNAAQPRAGGRKTQKTPALRRRRKRDVVPAVHTEGGRARELPAPA